MDRELAGVIIERWQTGQPVSETHLYKAAQALDIDPMAALVEARFYTYFDKCLLEKRAMSRGERIVFSAAAGLNDGPMVKSAAAYGFSPEELIIEALRDRDFVPDLEKIASLPRNIPTREFGSGTRRQSYPGHRVEAHLQGKAVSNILAGPHPLSRESSSLLDTVLDGARHSKDMTRKILSKVANLAPPGAPLPGMGGQGQPPPGQAAPPGAMPPMDPSQQGAAPSPEEQAGEVMMAPPDPNAMLQQQPGARIKPSPTGPEQVAASPGGNLDELLQAGQQAFGDQAAQNGGVAPQGMPEPPPPPPSPEERIKQVGPNLDDETVGRYAEQLGRFEEGFGMQISDPKQMVKFVKELQKVDGKKVDQGIKAMGQQLEQEQAQELGVDSTPTIDGPGGGAGGGPGTKMAPKPDANGQMPQNSQVGPDDGSQPGAADTQSGDGGPASGMEQTKQPRPPRPQPKAGPPQQQTADAAVEKVANAARALARASFL